jgi:peptidoglycan/LPS O-acetylase OafA/YrhL/lysophospholipase L1-like esterase
VTGTISAPEAPSTPPVGTRRPRLRHMPALDGVRGAAVIAVILYHDGQTGGATELVGGYLGVDLFFTLSGFLITSLLLREWADRGGVALGAFWSRRARRLLPAVLVLLAAIAGWALVFANDRVLDRIRDQALAALLYVANWQAIRADVPYAAGTIDRSPLQHMWSLAIEEQFYVVWPLLVVGLLWWRRGSLVVLLGVTVALAAASAAWMAAVYEPGDDRAYFGSDTRAASILVGAALAIVVARFGHVHDRTARIGVEVAGFLGVAVLAVAWWSVEQRSSGLYHGGMLVCAIAGAAVIAAVAHPEAGPLGSVLALPVLRFFGIVSYGLYLWHWPVFVWMTDDSTGLSGWGLTLARFAVTLGATLLSYRLVEQPIRHGALSGWTARLAAPGGMAVVGLLIVVGTAGAVAPVVPDADRPPTTRPEPVGTTAPATGTTADPGDGSATTSAPALPTGPLVVYVAGDSVAWSVGVGMQDRAEELGVFVDNRGLFGCGLFTGDGPVDVGGRRAEEIEAPVETDECRTKAATRWPEQLAALQPDVALLMVGAWDAFDHQLDGESVSACDPAFRARELAHATEAIEVLGSTGAHVVVVDPPYLRYDDGEFGPSREEADARIDCLRSVFEEAVAAAPGVTLIDFMPYVCPTPDTCVTEVDGEVLRPDGIHYDAPGGPIIARWLVPQLLDVVAGDP